MGRFSLGILLVPLIFAAALELSLAASKAAELMILPYQPVQTKPIGKNVLLTCRANVEDKHLISQLQWRDPSNRVIQSDGVTKPRVTTEMMPGDKALALIINSLRETDSGNYTCSAMYANTEPLVKVVRLETIVAITWEDAPEEQSPTLDSNYKIRCKVTASPSPIVDWLRDGEVIPSMGGHYVVETDGLLIQRATEADDGIYSCRAIVIETGEIAEKNIRVEVITPPVFEQMPSPVEVIEGETASILCKATGKPQPTFSWIKGSTKQNLASADRFTVNERTGELAILRVTQDDHGDFKCEAKNAAGRVEKTIKLAVVVKPKIIAYKNMSVATGKEGVLQCSASGRPLPTITFRKLSPPVQYVIGPQPSDDHIIVDNRDDNEKGERIGKLIFVNLLRADDGLYACVAKNKGGETLSNGHMTVEFAPSFANAPVNEVWSWNNNQVNITCLAESIPNATIAWRLNDRDIEQLQDPRIKKVGNGPESTLMVTPTDKRLYGAWKCIATNVHGTADHEILLKEAFPPSDILQAKLEVITATTITFSFMGPANNGGLPTRAYAVQYKEERKSWNDASNKTWPVDSPYILEGLEPQTTYNFRFAAKNDVGLGNWAAPELHTMPKRSFPEEPTILNNALEGAVLSPYSDRFELRWGVPADNGEPIDQYNIKYCKARLVNGDWKETEPPSCNEQVLQSHEHSGYELRSLRPDTHYKVELRAHNIIGFSTPAQVYVKTAPDPRIPGKMVSPTSKSDPVLSSGAIVGIVVASLFLVFIIVDGSCFCFNNTGLMYLMCRKSKSKKEEDQKLGRDEKEPLKDVGNGNKTAIKPVVQERPVKRDISVEYDGRKSLSRTTFVGKDSAV